MRALRRGLRARCRLRRAPYSRRRGCERARGQHRRPWPRASSCFEHGWDAILAAAPGEESAAIATGHPSGDRQETLW